MLIKDQKDQKAKDLFEKQVHREVPSQLPMVVTKKSYLNCITHGQHYGKGREAFYGCKTSGARMRVKVVLMNVFNADNSLSCANVPVGVIFCPSCDKKPNTCKGMPIYAQDVQTVSM